MKRIIVIENPHENHKMYLTEISYLKNENKTASIAYKSSSNIKESMIFIEDDDFELAFKIINLHIKRYHKDYKLLIENI